MYGICIESSHKRGMGHFFRMLQIVSFLKRKKKESIVMLNDDKLSQKILVSKKIKYEIVDLQDYYSDWETALIHKYRINIWINDRMETCIESAKKIKHNDVLLCAFDDTGSGRLLTDVNFMSLTFKKESLFNNKEYYGIDYLILNEEIKKYRKKRTTVKRILVSMGGSDTFHLTTRLYQFFKNTEFQKYSITLILGPANQDEIVQNEKCDWIQLKESVPSLIQEFINYDLAITGSGITPFEACATGLPCLTISSEPHEIQISKFLENLGCTIYLGTKENVDFEEIKTCISDMDIEKMSQTGLDRIPLNGLENVIEVIEKRYKNDFGSTSN